MKVFLLMLAVLFTCGCLTNPVTEENYAEDRPPMAVEWAVLTGVVPGLTQLINGEIVEAVIYAVGFFGPVAMALSSPPQSPLPFLLASPAQAIYAWSYVDGLAGTSERGQQYLRIQKKRAAGPPLGGVLSPPVAYGSRQPRNVRPAAQSRTTPGRARSGPFTGL